MKPKQDTNADPSLKNLNLFGDCSSSLDILSSVAEADFLRSLTTVDILTQNEAAAIKALNHYSEMAGFTAEAAAEAQDIIVSCRQVQNESKVGKGNSNFDRLIYLLDRYIEYCQSINLKAWPIDHLKISIWIKNDVIVTTNSTRMKPLRKTVRCYVTSLESIRIKTLHIFKEMYLSLHLMKSKVILEILNGLSLDRDNLEERLGGNQPVSAQNSSGDEQSSEREMLIEEIRSNSGDDRSAEAMKAVKASRSGELEAGEEKAAANSKLKSKSKPDPHIHTLKRYRNFCFLNQIPMWPIDAPRVALWLRESVLVIDPRSKNKKSGVSFRTVQVYLSRLEYARLKTEHLFHNCANHGISLYKAKEIINILKELNPTNTEKFPASKEKEIDRKCEATDNEEQDILSKTETQEPLSDTYPRWPTVLRTLENSSAKKRKFQAAFNDPELVKGREFKLKKRIKSNSRVPSENIAARVVSKSGKPRSGLRDVSNRRNPSMAVLRADTAPEFSLRLNVKNIRRQSPSSSPINDRASFPPISEWFLPSSPSPVKTKGCLSFILCSEEDSEASACDQSTREPSTPFDSPTRNYASNKMSLEFPSTDVIESPTFNRFWSLHSASEVLRS